MNIVFCPECGGRNSVSLASLKKSDDRFFSCSICGHEVSSESFFIRDGVASARGVLDTTRYHLLFIDDDKAYLKLAKSILGRDYTVSVASSGEKGLVLAEELQPDIILLDVKMPGEDGYEICHKLKHNHATRHIAVFFVTATFASEDIHRGFALGAVDYIHKPLQLDELHARITLQIRLRQLVE